jgi:hypothetical protein
LEGAGCDSKAFRSHGLTAETPSVQRGTSPRAGTVQRSFACSALAEGEKAEGTGVAVDRGTVGDLVLDGDLLWAAPVEEGFLDPVTVGVTANDAKAAVALG